MSSSFRSSENVPSQVSGFAWVQNPMDNFCSIASIVIKSDGPCPVLNQCGTYTVCGIHKG